MAANDDFDENGVDELENKKSSDEFARMLEESFQSSKRRKLSPGDKIKAEILVIGKEEVFVSTGAQSDGSVHRRDLLDADGNLSHKVGDTLTLYVTQVKGGQVSLSPNPTAKNFADDLEDAFDLMLPVEGRVTELCKGGVRVSVMGKSAFCPISQLDSNRTETGEEFIGKKLSFRITQFSEGGRNIVVSRRKLLDEERSLTAGSFLEEHKAGDVVPGRIARIEKFGAFVELAPGVDGLAHISELSWSRVADPSEVVKVGDEVQAKILKMENEGGKIRISLSLKDSGQNPWTQVPEKFPVGSVHPGKVTRKEAYGLFVELAGGIVGLLPKSKAVEDSAFPFDKLHPGDETTVQIMELRLDEHRIALCPPGDSSAEDWKGFAPKATGSFGTLGDQMKAAMERKSKS